MNIPTYPRLLLLHLAGHFALFGKYPKLDELPNELAQRKKNTHLDSLSYLSEKGFILGTPSSFRVNHIKFAALKAAETGLAASPERPKQAPAVMTLLRKFNDEHKRIRKVKARTNSKALIHFRTLCRKYEAHLIEDAISLFFKSESIRALTKPLSTEDFYSWTDRQLRTRLKKERK